MVLNLIIRLVLFYSSIARTFGSEFDYHEDDVEVFDPNSLMTPPPAQRTTPSTRRFTGRRTFIRRRPTYDGSYSTEDSSRVIFPDNTRQIRNVNKEAPVEMIKYYDCRGFAMKCQVRPRSRQEFPLQCKMVSASLL